MAFPYGGEEVRRYIQHLEQQKVNTAPLNIHAPYLDMIKNVLITPLTNLYNTFINDMREVSFSFMSGNIAKAFEKLLPYIVTSVGISLTFDLLQTQILGISINLRKTLDKIDRIFSPEIALSIFAGEMLRNAVEIPVSRYLKSVFTPEIPDLRTLSIGFFKGYYSLEELRKYYRMAGYPDRFHDLILDLNDFTPSISYIERIVRYYPVNKEVLIDWLKENGVRKEELMFWLDYLNYAMLRDEYAKYEAVVRDLYVSGYMSDAELDYYLQQLKANPRERDVVKEMWRMLKMKNLYKMYVDKQIYLFRKGVIDASELEKRLQAFIVDTDIAEAITLVELAKQGVDAKGKYEVGGARERRTQH
jgi:hypothetical protein